VARLQREQIQRTSYKYLFVKIHRMPATRRSSGAAAAAVTAKPTARRPSTIKKSKTVADMVPSTCTPFFVPPPPPMLPEPSSSGTSGDSTDLRRRTLKGKVRAKVGETEELTELSADDKSRLLQEVSVQE